MHKPIEFCLDGQQLKLVSGIYGAPGSVYATEIESFSRIVASGSAGAGPASFIVTTKQGLVYEYGGTTDARVFAGASGSIRTWALSKIRDRAGANTGNSIGTDLFQRGAERRVWEWHPSHLFDHAIRPR